MFGVLRLLPWEYGIRNLFRRPLRTLLTIAGLTTVILLVLTVIGFIRGLDRSLAVSGDPATAIISSLGMGRNLEYSAISMRTRDLVAASVPGIWRRYGQHYVSAELYLGTEVVVAGRHDAAFGLIRGVSPSVLLVRQQVELVDGNWPGAGQVIVGQLVATKLGGGPGDVRVGKMLEFEGRRWEISGLFAAGGSVFESEIWCRLDDLQLALKRQDLSVVAVKLRRDRDFADLDLFCKERLDLELQVMPETEYYAALQRDYRPVRMLAWLVVLLVAGAGVFAGLNTMYGSVIGRIRELSTLQTIGFGRRAIAVSLVQEGLLLAAAASLLAACLALLFVDESTVRFTMGAFPVQVDSVSILIGCGVGLLVGLVGTIPPAVRALRMPIVKGLKTV